MTKEARRALRAVIVDRLDDDMMPITVGGHTITNQYVYAGCSQWCGCGRDWDETQHAMAWIVNGEYQLTFPKLDYFDGHNQIERQSAYYLQPDRGETPPSEPCGEPLLRVPDRALIDIGKGLLAALTEHAAEQSADDREAVKLAAQLA